MAPRISVVVSIGACMCAINGLIAIERHDTLYKMDNTRASDGTLPVTTTALTTVRCVSKCLEKEGCESVNYHKQSKECELTTVKYPANPDLLEAANGWKWMHRKTIKGKRNRLQCMLTIS
jgi:hypothetical protein